MVFDHAELEETVPGRLRQRSTTGNGNLDVLGANIAFSGRPLFSQSFGCALYGRKSVICRWHFDGVCHTFGDISTSGFGGHIAISGCRSSSIITVFEIDMVDSLRFVAEKKQI